MELTVVLAGGSKVQPAPFWDSWRTKLTGKCAQRLEQICAEVAILSFRGLMILPCALLKSLSHMQRPAVTGDSGGRSSRKHGRSKGSSRCQVRTCNLH
jgi:hypothetical protein